MTTNPQTDPRARIAAALSSMTVVGGTPPQLLVPVLDASNPRMARIVDWQPLEGMVDAVLAAAAVPSAPTTQTAARAALAEDLRYLLNHREPRHAHEKPGVWDTSGKPCDHCARLAVARQNVAAYDAAVPAAVEEQPDTNTPPVDPWSISYHQLGPAENNPAVCICGLGPEAVLHNEPPHRFNGRPKPGMPPVHGICTDCHHHETAACHTAAVAQPGKEN